MLRGRGVGDRARRRLLAWGLVGSVLPDLDLFYFYLVSDRRTVHHEYLPHLPLAWLPLFAVIALGLAAGRANRVAWIGLAVVGVNVLGHLLLDTVAGGIQWLWPFSRTEVVVAHVQARHQPWVLNFVLHWTFALEVLLVAVAGWWFVRQRSRTG